MPDATNILLPLLELLADGHPHVACILERQLAVSLPLNLTCQTDKVLLDLLDEGCLTEGDWNVFKITPAGMALLEELRRPKPVEPAKPKQGLMF